MVLAAMVASITTFAGTMYVYKSHEFRIFQPGAATMIIRVELTPNNTLRVWHGNEAEFEYGNMHYGGQRTDFCQMEN